jgi:hypothetical protein
MPPQAECQNFRDSLPRESLSRLRHRQALGGDNAGAEYTESKISNAAALEETKRAITGNAMREVSARTIPEEPVSAPTGETVQDFQNEEGIARIEVRNGHEAQAVEQAGHLETPERVRRLIAIAEALVDSPSSSDKPEHGCPVIASHGFLKSDYRTSGY